MAAVTSPGNSPAVKPNGSTSLRCLSLPTNFFSSALNASANAWSSLRKAKAP
ncbi:Uncharacterised protein [Bordetella pertussis]|nr:Uncharacterised protein [Bordetella pertussis]